MSAAAPELTVNHYDQAAGRVLDAAVGQAALTRFEKVGSSHILLALLQKEEPLVDGLLRDSMKGLRAVTLADALREELTIEADLNDYEAGNFPEEGLPRATDLTGDAIELLGRADRYADAWGRTRVPAAAIACAAFDAPDTLSSRVLRGIGIRPEQCQAVAAAIAATQKQATETIAGEPVFVANRLNPSAFEPALRGVLTRFGSIAADRLVTENDLLAALLEDPSSRVADALRHMQLDPQSLLAALRDMSSPASTTANAAADIPEERISRLVRRVFSEARTLADTGGEAFISESHLTISHIDRVASADGNLFVRLKIDPTALRSLLSLAATAGEQGVFADGLLRPEVFGPIARAALASLAPIAASRRLLDSDLLLALLNQSESRLTETLLVAGAPLPSIRAALTQMGGKTPADVDGTKGEIRESQVSALLQTVLADAWQLAGSEGAQLLAESHLLRSHIDRVAGSTGNIYERLGIDVRRLFDVLGKNRADRSPETPKKDKGATETVTDIAAFLNARVVNQAHAVAAATKALIRMRSGLNEPGQVMGKFLFLGPTGVGKTELARAMAAVAFGAKPGARDAHIIRIDCGNFQNRWDVVQLIGAAQGLVGYKEGQLTNGLKDKPRSIILFDEAEKADKAIWQSLLPLFDEGIVREADGTQCEATGCILLATSNVGYSAAIESLNVWDRKWEDVRDEVQQMVWNALGSYFSPEFLGRFGRENVLYFNHFSQQNYREMLDLQINSLVTEMSGRGLEVSLSDRENTLELLSEKAWADRREGARPIRRLVTAEFRDRIIAARGDDPERTVFRFACLRGSGEIVLEAH